MQRGLSKSVKKVVVRNHLQGLDQNENSKSASSGVAGAKLTIDEVNSIVKEFDSDVSSRGLDSASKDYGVSSLTKELFEIARLKRENHIEFSSILLGSKIAGTLKKFGAGIPEFEQFLDSVYARSLEKGFTPNEIIAQSSKLQALEKKYGTSFDALKSNFEDLGKAIVSKKKEKADLESEISQVVKKKSDLLSRFSLDEQKIQDYVNTKQQLASFGLDISDLQNMRSLLISLKSEKFDPKEIIDKIRTIGDLQVQKAKTQQELAAARNDLESKKAYLSEIRKLEESKLSFDQVERLRNLVAKISLDHKIDPAQAYTRFEQEVLQNYNTLLGLKPEIARLEDNKKRIEAEYSSRKKEVESNELVASERIKKLDEKYSKQRAEIDAYSELRALGVDGKRVLLWDQIIKSANLDYGIIEGELRNQSNLKNLEDKMSSKIKELVAQEVKLNQSITELNSEKEKIESAIKAIKENALNGIEEFRSSVLSSISSLKDQAVSGLQETTRQGQKSLDDLKITTESEMKQLSESALSDMQTTFSDLKSTAFEFSKELKESISLSSTEIKNVGLALDAGEKIGKYRNILPLLQLIDGSGTQDESEALIAMWNLTSRFNAWLENHYPGEKKEISGPLSRLLESINNEIQRVGGV